jgi:hypothetical protein
MPEILDSRVMHYTKDGATVPVVDMLVRTRYGKKEEWQIMIGVRDGVPFAACIYKTRKDALAAWMARGTWRW